MPSHRSRCGADLGLSTADDLISFLANRLMLFGNECREVGEPAPQASPFTILMNAVTEKLECSMIAGSLQ